MNECPKCRFELLGGALECPACGIVFEKYRALGPGPASKESAPPARTPVPLAETVEAPPPAPTENPYAPPAAALQSPASSLGVDPSSQALTPATVEALQKARPWMTFVAIYTLVCTAFLILAAVMVILSSLTSDGFGEGSTIFAVGFAYGANGLLVLYCVLPLRRSAMALKKIPLQGTSAGMESFAIEHGQFWQRIGKVLAVALILFVLFLLGAVFLGVIAAFMN